MELSANKLLTGWADHPPHIPKLWPDCYQTDHCHFIRNLPALSDWLISAFPWLFISSAKSAVCLFVGAVILAPDQIDEFLWLPNFPFLYISAPVYSVNCARDRVWTKRKNKEFPLSSLVRGAHTRWNIKSSDMKSDTRRTKYVQVL